MSFEDEFPESSYWDPKQDAVLKGIVVERTTRESEYHTEPVPSLVIETVNGETVTVTGFRSVLRDEILAKNPQVGDLIKIGYGGEKTAEKTGRTFYQYGVKILERASTPAQPSLTDEPF